eukprot:358696-Chlamydomonas_euryale.AAC.7
MPRAVAGGGGGGMGRKGGCGRVQVLHGKKGELRKEAGVAWKKGGVRKGACVACMWFPALAGDCCSRTQTRRYAAPPTAHLLTLVREGMQGLVQHERTGQRHTLLLARLLKSIRALVPNAEP